MIGRRLRDLVEPEDVALFDTASREMAETGTAELECRVRRPDGGCGWVHALLRARRDERGRLIEVVRTVRNVSAQKARQAALARVTESFESAFQHAPIGMTVLGLDGSWIKVNRAFCALTAARTPRADVLAGLSLSQRLKDALSGGSFILHAQPIVDLHTRVVATHGY